MCVRSLLLFCSAPYGKSLITHCIFLLVVGHNFLLVYISSNFLVDAGQYKHYMVEDLDLVFFFQKVVTFVLAGS